MDETRNYSGEAQGCKVLVKSETYRHDIAWCRRKRYLMQAQALHGANGKRKLSAWCFMVQVQTLHGANGKRKSSARRCMVQAQTA